MRTGPLAGVKVVEVGGSSASSVAGGLLSDLGATVILLEPEAGTWLRNHPGFQIWARGKESVAVRDPAGYAVTLAPGADIVIVDEAAWEQAGQFQDARVTLVVERLGDAPRASAVSEDAAASAAEALAGLMYTQQGTREGPYYIIEQPGGFGTGILGAIGAVVALYANQNDESEVVRVSHVGGTLAMQLFSAVAAAGLPPTSLPLDGDPRRVTTPLIRFYEAQDGWMVIGAPSPTMWGKLCIALDMPELVSDPRFEGAPFNIQEAGARVWLTDQVQSRIATRTVSEWMNTLRQFGVTCAPVLEPGAILDDPQTKAIGMRAELNHPVLGHLIGPGIPIEFPDDQVSPNRAAPELNDHDVETLRSFQNVTNRMPARDKGLPLAGIRLIDFSGFAAGPGAARLLSGLGAEVTKVEGPDGDPFRFIGFSFASVNRGKRSVMLDLTTSEGRSQAYRLIRGSDIVLHNLRPSLQEKLGLDSISVERAQQGIIQGAVYGYGSVGPYADLPAIDVVFEALTGGCLVQGGGREPVGFSGGLADNGTSLMGTLGIVAALYGKKNGRPGRRVEVSLMRTTIYRHSEFLVRPLSTFNPEDFSPDPAGPNAGLRLYRTQDGWLLLAITDVGQWASLVKLLPKLSQSFSTDVPTWNEKAAGQIEHALQEMPTHWWLAAFANSGVPAVPAQTLRDFALEAAKAGSSLVATFSDPEWGEMVGLNELVQFEAHDWKALGRAPRLGEHNDLLKALT